MRETHFIKCMTLLPVLIAVIMACVGVSSVMEGQGVPVGDNPQKIEKPLAVQKLQGDLSISISQCPQKSFNAGENIPGTFVITARSTYIGRVPDIAVDLILTSVATYPVPAPYAVYSDHYSANVLLKGGRTHVTFPPRGTVPVPFHGDFPIPADTPPGTYYLGVVVDAGNKAAETDERNNVAFCKISIGGTQNQQPDLIVSAVDFQKVKQLTDAQGNQYWIFNVVITVKNQGGAVAGPSKVLLERNVGPGGAYTQACATCIIEIPAINPGNHFILPPRQFNNANHMNSLFRATADIGNVVAESNETNNMNATDFH